LVKPVINIKTLNLYEENEKCLAKTNKSHKSYNNILGDGHTKKQQWSLELARKPVFEVAQHLETFLHA